MLLSDLYNKPLNDGPSLYCFPKQWPKMNDSTLILQRNNLLQNNHQDTCYNKFSNTSYHLKHSFQNTYYEHHVSHNKPNYPLVPILFLLELQKSSQLQKIQRQRQLLQQLPQVHQQKHQLKRLLQLLLVMLLHFQFSYPWIQIIQQ